MGFLFLNDTAVDFELLLAGATCADACGGAACDTFEVGPHGAKTGVGVDELSEFDLQASFVGLGASCKDVEDEFGAVENFTFDDLLDVADL